MRPLASVAEHKNVEKSKFWNERHPWRASRARAPSVLTLDRVFHRSRARTRKRARYDVTRGSIMQQHQSAHSAARPVARSGHTKSKRQRFLTGLIQWKLCYRKCSCVEIAPQSKQEHVDFLFVKIFIMEHYQKAETKRYSGPPEPHEIRVASRMATKDLLSRALTLLEVSMCCLLLELSI